MTLVCEFCDKVYQKKFWYEQHIEKHLSTIVYDALEVVLPSNVFVIENGDYEYGLALTKQWKIGKLIRDKSE